MKYYKHIILITSILFVLIIFFSPINSLFDINIIYEEKEKVLLFLNKKYYLASFIYILVYLFFVSFSIPGVTVLTLLGGFIFKPCIALLFVLFSSTLGAAFVFIISRYKFFNKFDKKYGSKLSWFNKELSKHSTGYLLFIRVIPILPFFIVNVLCGLSNISFRKFLITTLTGIIPIKFLYVYVGYIGNDIKLNNLNNIFKIIIPLVIIILLTILGIIKIRKAAQKELF